MRRLADGLRLGLFAVFFASAVFAQRDLATITGTVTDSTGGVVANAKVTITDVGTGVSTTASTDGSARVARLPCSAGSERLSDAAVSAATNNDGSAAAARVPDMIGKDTTKRTCR